MKNTLMGYATLAFLAIILLIPGGTARASNPSISSFAVSPLSVANGQPINISWALADAGGHSLLISCQQAVVVRKLDGSIFPCNTRTSISSQASDGTTITVSNISGVLQQLTITIIPKDSSGADYNGVQQSTMVTIGANQNTVTSFTTATSTPTGVLTEVTWTTATDVPGVNFMIGCTTSDLTATAPSLSFSQLPCGTVISSSNFPANSSLGILFVNRSVMDVKVPVTIVPAITAGTYDAIHGVQKTIVVEAPKKIEALVISFTASGSQILSGDRTTLSWTTQNASGVNLKFNCNENISVARVTNTATTSIACGNFVFDQALTENSATVVITNMTFSKQTSVASILPSNADKTYNGMQQKDLNISVLGMGVTTLPAEVTAVAPVAVTPIATTTATAPGAGCITGYLFSITTGQACPSVSPTITASAVSPTQTVTTAKKFTFTKPLSRNSKGTEVTALQQFFANYPETYGKVTVNGTFGPATQKLVMKFQEKHNIAKKGFTGYGTVGPATRAKLNTLQ